MVGIKHESMRKGQTSHKKEHNTRMCFPLKPVFTRDKGGLPNFIDEPTSGLDPFSRDELIFIFEELKKRGVCILFSTHIISDIEKCADDIMYIQNGHIIADCSKETFKQKLCENESFEECILRMERDVKID